MYMNVIAAKKPTIIAIVDPIKILRRYSNKTPEKKLIIVAII